MRRWWLIVCQVVTIICLIIILLACFKPEWINSVYSFFTPSSDSVQPQTSVSAAPPSKPAEAPNIPNFNQFTFRHVVANAKQAVVDIRTTQRVRGGMMGQAPLFPPFFGGGDDGFDEPSRQSRVGLGSGVIATSDGVILTNNHVLEEADDIQVVLSTGETYTPQIVGTDPDTDLAVLRIPAKNLPTIPFAAPDATQVGDVVLAIGNPFGVGQTVTMGIISALGRSKLGINTYEKFIQTDAAINPGNSGGPLIDLNGNLIGINTAIFSKTGGSLGIGFAIPIEMVKNIMDQILTKGQVTRGWLGATVAPLTPEDLKANNLKEPVGAVVARLMRGGPAQRGGLQINDVITSVNGKKVADSDELVNLIAELEPGAEAQIQFYRDGQPMTATVKIETRPVMRAR